ncbi:MAG: isochorismatase family protein [Candidatus Obscuribacterales bacterium]|nr:isochorismatase family protein [Candidatus Obscuribacterales bacterium]
MSEKETVMNATINDGAVAVKRALGLVDPLNDFGSETHGDGNGNTAQLPVPEGELIGAPIGQLQEKGGYDYTFAGLDQHDRKMFNFASQNPGRTPYVDQVLDRDGQPATVYPDHCIEKTWGAQFLPGVRADLVDEIFPKGDSIDKDSYSACGNPNLLPRLRQLGITHVDLVGLVFRICVGMTAVDLAKAGFKVRVVMDCTRDLEIPAFEPVIAEMKALGVELVNSCDIIGN